MIFLEKSVFFSFQSPKPTNKISLISRVFQDKLGPMRFFKDGRKPRIGWCGKPAINESSTAFQVNKDRDPVIGAELLM